MLARIVATNPDGTYRVEPLTAPRVGQIRAHLTRHLTPNQMRALGVLVQAVTLDEAAPLLGLSNRTSVEHYWFDIIDHLGIARDGGGHGVNRLRVARVAWGLDPCFCEPDP
jgi:hypothetical protein